MTKPRNIIRVSRKPTLWLATAVLAMVPMVFAHGGFNHVMGTAAKVSGNVLTIKTVNGDVDIRLGDRTQLTKNDRPAHIADLKPGARVVAEVPEGSKDNLAQSVKIGSVPKTAAVRQIHASHK